MKLSELLENAKAQFDISRGNDEITEIIYDSRTESPDKSGLFICIKKRRKGKPTRIGYLSPASLVLSHCLTVSPLSGAP